jgi:hypothetical protein
LTGTAPTPAPAPLLCRCGRLLGTAHGPTVRLGDVVVIGKVRLRCPDCGAVRYYLSRPAVDKPAGGTP